VIVEIVDGEGRPVPPGRGAGHNRPDGNLHNYATPLIRTGNGPARGSWTPGGAPAAGNRTGSRKWRDGTADIIDGLNGRKVFSYFFASLFFSLNWAGNGTSSGDSKFNPGNEEQLTLKPHCGTTARRQEEKSASRPASLLLGPMKITIALPGSNDHLPFRQVSVDPQPGCGIKRAEVKPALSSPGHPDGGGPGQDRIARAGAGRNPRGAAPTEGSRAPGRRTAARVRAPCRLTSGGAVKAMTYSTIEWCPRPADFRSGGLGRSCAAPRPGSRFRTRCRIAMPRSAG